ncbi:MAG TPA: hypothetical protein VFR94_16520 [Nitrososphaeraceae archaeon]|nr:hypothetical protein [Nitrososphaeraceae archaeon]
MNSRRFQRIIVFSLLAILITGSLFVIPSALPSYATSGNTTDDNTFYFNPYSTLAVTPNMIAAGGPVVPNWTMAQQEAECAAETENPGWARTLMPAEHYDSARSELFPCSQFPGSLTGPNNVFAYPSSDMWYAPFSMATRGVDEMYIYGGASGDAKPSALQPYVARVELGTLNEIWRTYLNNINVTNDFSIAGAVYVLPDGSIGTTAGHKAYKLNATTGAVLAGLTLPTGDNPSRDSGFNGFSVFPGDGNLIFKSFNRPTGCELNGYSAAAYKCPGAPDSANPSVLVVVDPKTWKALDWIQSTENSAGRITATEFNSKNYAYFAGTSSVFRYVWDGNNITLDETWGPVPYLKPGQTLSGSVMILGDWVVLTTNGNPSDVPMSVVAISQSNASRVTKLDPIPLEPGQQSTYYAHGAVDPQNNRIYAMDAGVHKAFAVDIHPSTGNMSVAWVEPQWSQSYITLIGPSYNRVFVNTNMSSPLTQNVSEMMPWPDGANYVEQIQWRDAETGKLLAASDFFPSAAAYATVPVGYGGLIYDILNIGNIVALQVLPQQANTTSIPTPSPNSTSTTSEAGG